VAADARPSRRGAGDDRLHDRSGDFYYRRTFTLPDTRPGDDRMLVIGAVDDFDATYINGTQIGATGVETPQHWQVPRYYRVPAGLLRKGQPMSCSSRSPMAVSTAESTGRSCWAWPRR